MSLRCRKGDLARIVDVGGANHDHFVECIAYDPTRTFAYVKGIVGCWYVKSTSKLVCDRYRDGLVGRVVDRLFGPKVVNSTEGWIPDQFLIPIRDPGDEAADSRDINLGEAMRTQVREGADA